MADWVFAQLTAAHRRAEFSCGKPQLDLFLRTLVSQYEKRRLGRTIVATEPGRARVAGYYTLAAGSVDVACLPETLRKKLPKHPIPTIHLGRLAVDLLFRGQGLREALLLHALRAALGLSEKLGAFAVEVWCIDDEAKAFYRRYGFLAFSDDPLHCYLPMKTVEAMCKG